MLHTWNDGMMEYWNVGFQRKFFIYNHLELPYQYAFYKYPCLRATHRQALYHFHITQYSIVPLFQHSNCGAKRS